MIDSSEPVETLEGELPSQDEVDQKAAETIDQGNADTEYERLVEEINREG